MSIILHVGEYVDMIKSGIIDPLKVIRTALVDAARLVGSIVLSCIKL